MSLKDPDEDYNELVPEKKSFFNKIIGKSKKYLIILVAGIVLGAVIQYWLINPVLNSAQADVCKDCFNLKTVLNEEHECLYRLVPDPTKAAEQCKLGGTQAPTPESCQPPAEEKAT